MSQSLSVARTSAGAEVALPPGVANRHGLITGATGTGKTVTLQVLAEALLAHRRADVHGGHQRRPRRPGGGRHG